jgi:hypothetical protein
MTTLHAEIAPELTAIRLKQTCHDVHAEFTRPWLTCCDT